MYKDKYGDEWLSEELYIAFSGKKAKKKKKTDKTLPGRHYYGLPRGKKPKCTECKKRESTTTTHLGRYVCQQCFLNLIDNW